MKRKPTVGPPPPPGAKKPRAKTVQPRARTPEPVDDSDLSELDRIAIEALDPNNKSGLLKGKRAKTSVPPPTAPPPPAAIDPPTERQKPSAAERWAESARKIVRAESHVVADSFERQDSLDVALDSFDGSHADATQYQPNASGSFEMSADEIAALTDDESQDVDVDDSAGFERAVSLSDEQLIAEVPEVPVLRVAICETHGHLAGAHAATVAAGHEVVIGAAGLDGAQRVIDTMRRDGVDVVIVALSGTSDARAGGAETQVIDAALSLEPRRPIVIASVPGMAVDGVRRAHQAGADLVTLRPHDVDRLAPVLLGAARLSYERDRVANARGAESVLRAKLEQVSQPEPGGLESLEMFQRMLETEIKRARRYEYPLSVAMFAVEIDPPPPPPGVRGILRARIGNVLVRTIRDIDVATQLDHERFLVLLPYTDLTGATNVARRIIDSIRIGDPVVAGGRSFPPRVVGAVAGASPGQQMSFTKLVGAAGRALDQARRDGAELAVQP